MEEGTGALSGGKKAEGVGSGRQAAFRVDVMFI